MQVFSTVEEIRKIVKGWRREGLSVGLVPTMGFLHEGHRSLIDCAVRENDRVVVSVFVNPIQFGPNEDLASYPRNLEADTILCEKAGAHALFHPAPEEMYLPGFCTFVDVPDLSRFLCGKTRPTHFRGMCTVVSKLFHIVMPDRAYFGQKDAQQLAIVRRMVRDLQFDIQIVGCPIIREPDGLAKSSRNTYLNPEERRAAVVLSRAVALGREMMEHGERSAAAVESAMKCLIEQEPLARIDYVTVADAQSMTPVERIEGPVLCAMAVYIGTTRLIDNFFFGDPLC
ncbi:MAG: pantoate--beta-alanine ligase [Desulfovibrionaceae bacterium]|nr:pantoate--beta-alanine ligase [Desulfovibrionaceae bacterium]